YVGADRRREQQALLAAMQEALASDVDNAVFTREVGWPAVQAVHALGRGDAARAVQLLRPVRSNAHRFGGSHAQRDLVDLTLIEAAQRAGDVPLAAGLAAERRAQRPHSALARHLAARSPVAAGARMPAAA
ncbi:MAG TPA: tetratricopeptide repeat protein, partial [Rubrivivax sp.]|nr:tetratricopeptide repeat protein [Rubrivivax sp.]